MAALSVMGAHAAEWNVQAGLTQRHDNNLNNSTFDSDIARDKALNFFASTATLWPFESGGDLGFRGAWSAEAYDRYEGMDHYALTGELSGRRKWGLGPFAPWTRVAWSATRLNFANSIRNGWLRQLTFSTGKRLTEEWSLYADYRWERRTAHDLAQRIAGVSGDVFSQRGRNLNVGVEYAWSNSGWLDATYLLRDGDLVASTRIHRGSTIRAVSTAIAGDPVFGSDFIAYKLSGKTQGLSLAARYVPARDWQLSLSLQHWRTHGAGNNDYKRTQTTVGLQHDF
ncbi:MAG TPA: hypothetical protein VJ001_03110 [Rhodocyclaceae bacterium]|nr:hypothetical protein [Rhodocyclaceae bacterium]